MLASVIRQARRFEERTDVTGKRSTLAAVPFEVTDNGVIASLSDGEAQGSMVPPLLFPRTSGGLAVASSPLHLIFEISVPFPTSHTAPSLEAEVT